MKIYNRGFGELLLIGVIGVLALLGAYYLSKTFSSTKTVIKTEKSSQVVSP